LSLCIAVIAAIGSGSALAQEKISTIEIKDVPLGAAVANLATQAELNHILDPRVPGSSFEPGKSAPQPNVTFHGTNLSAHEAFSQVLKQNKLVLVTNSATPVLRVLPAGVAPRTGRTNDLEPVAEKVIPRIGMDFVSLPDALTQLGAGANLTFTFNADLSAALSKRGTVSFAWKNITIRQTIMALLENFDLVLVKGEQPSAFRVEQRKAQ
jgi:hypothetical protein